MKWEIPLSLSLWGSSSSLKLALMFFFFKFKPLGCGEKAGVVFNGAAVKCGFPNSSSWLKGKDIWCWVGAWLLCCHVWFFSLSVVSFLCVRVVRVRSAFMVVGLVPPLGHVKLCA